MERTPKAFGVAHLILVRSMSRLARWVVLIIAGFALAACLHTSPQADIALLIRNQTADEWRISARESDSNGDHPTSPRSPLVGKSLCEIGLVKEIVIIRGAPGEIKRGKRIWPPDSLIVHALRDMRLSPAQVSPPGGLRKGECYVRITYSNRRDVYLLFHRGRPIRASVKTAPNEISEYSLFGDPKI
jgi:hypothetical protein